jgi:hypothetical protein
MSFQPGHCFSLRLKCICTAAILCFRKVSPDRYLIFSLLSKNERGLSDHQFVCVSVCLSVCVSPTNIF